MSSYAVALTPLIRTILETSDLSTISAKGVRKVLVSRGQDEATIKANRGDIDQIISGLYDELTQAGNASDSSEEKPLLNTPSGSQQTAHPPSSVPRPLAKPKVKREPKSEVKASPEIEGEDDEAYARQLQSEFNSYAARPSRASATATRRPKKVVKNNRSAATVDSGDEGEPKPKRAAPNTAFNKDLILSDPLSALVNETRLSRPQTVKRIWDYVKARELQDPSDKRYIMCDGPLKEVFHTDRLHMFTMNKILAKHFMDPEDIIDKTDEAVAKDEKPM